MDCLGNEISEKMKNTIRAKLIELDVYVDDELPDYIMVLVANKKTDKQIEDDLKLFLGVHTTTFVQWLNDLLDKLKDLTGQGTTNSESKIKPKVKEKKLKSTKLSKASDPNKTSESSKVTESVPAAKKKTGIRVSNTTKSVKSGGNVEKKADGKPLKRKKLRINEELSAKKLKNITSVGENKAVKPSKSKKSTDKPKPVKKSLKRTADDVSTASKEHNDVPDDSEFIVEKKIKTIEKSESPVSSNSSVKGDFLSKEEDVNERGSSSVQSKHPDTTSTSEPISHSSENLEEASCDIEQQSAVPTRHLHVTASSSSNPPPAERSSTNTEVKKTRTKPIIPSESQRQRPVSRRLVSLTRTVETEQRQAAAVVAPAPRAGLFSRVGAIVSRSVADEEEDYDPTRPSVGRVASTVKVSERCLPPAHRQAPPNLLMKAMRDAQKSTVASVKPFLVRETVGTKSSVQANGGSSGGGQGNDLRSKLSTSDGGDPKPKRAPVKEYRQDLMQIAITVRNNCGSCDVKSKSQASTVVKRQPIGSPTKKVVGGSVDLVDALREEHEEEEEEEDGVNVTIGTLKPLPEQTSSAQQPAVEKPALTGTDSGSVDVSADGYIASLLHQTGTGSFGTPASVNNSGPTFVVTMTGMGSGPADTTITEEVEEVEEVVEEESLPATAKRPPVFTRKNRVAASASTTTTATIRPQAISVGDPSDNIDRTLERCRFWPACSSGSKCHFYHPTSACTLFPRCGPADRCASIHPPCRYNGVCTRSDCQFSHGPQSSASRPQGPRTAAPAAPIAVSCKFANKCNNKQCRYQHPPPCRYGAACRNRLCSFTHPTAVPVSRVDRHQYKWAAATS